MGLNVGTPWRCGLNRGISLAEEVSISARIRKTAIALVLVFLCSQAAGCALTGKPGSPRTDSAKPTVSASPTLGAYTIRANTGEGPNVREVTVREGRKMAAEFCTDLLQQGLSKAQIALSLKASDVDGFYVKWFAMETVCPEIFGPSATATPGGIDSSISEMTIINVGMKSTRGCRCGI